MNSDKGTLYLIPVTLGGGDPADVLPARTLSVLRQLTHFVVENAKSARQFLRAAQYPLPMQSVIMMTLDEHTPSKDVPALLEPLVLGNDCGLVSEAGCPVVADPGSLLVRLAQKSGIRVVPLAGPSSILLALMASGLAGQRFRFHGYLPVQIAARQRRLQELERAAEASDETQIFIEAPYRNASMMQSLLECCRSDTLLCVAADITLSAEYIATNTIECWRVQRPDLSRRPCVFLLHRSLK